MEAKAILKFVGIGPRKARGVIDLIRGKGAEEALSILKFSPRHAARIIGKLLKSAVANAAQKKMGSADQLWVSKAVVDSGPAMKRTQPRAKGRAFLIRKRISHISLEVSQREGAATKEKSHKVAGKKG
jgi:large subunit ribosomal protein L22